MTEPQLGQSDSCSDFDWEGCAHGVMEGWCYQCRPAGPPVLTAEQQADIVEAVRAYWQRWGVELF